MAAWNYSKCLITGISCSKCKRANDVGARTYSYQQTGDLIDPYKLFIFGYPFLMYSTAKRVVCGGRMLLAEYMQNGAERREMTYDGMFILICICSIMNWNELNLRQQQQWSPSSTARRTRHHNLSRHSRKNFNWIYFTFRNPIPTQTGEVECCAMLCLRETLGGLNSLSGNYCKSTF